MLSPFYLPYQTFCQLAWDFFFFNTPALFFLTSYLSAVVSQLIGMVKPKGSCSLLLINNSHVSMCICLRCHFILKWNRILGYHTHIWSAFLKKKMEKSCNYQHLTKSVGVSSVHGASRGGHLTGLPAMVSADCLSSKQLCYLSPCCHITALWCLLVWCWLLGAYHGLELILRELVVPQIWAFFFFFNFTVSDGIYYFSVTVIYKETVNKIPHLPD